MIEAIGYLNEPGETWREFKIVAATLEEIQRIFKCKALRTDKVTDFFHRNRVR